MKSILLIGKAGQVGWELQQTLSSVGKVIGVARDRLDLTQPAAIRRLIETTQPGLIVNAAAYTAVDKAETEVELAKAINTIAPQVMAEAAQQIGAALIHISTDYVFDGTHNLPYLETDATNPVSSYGQSKRDGELAIEQIQSQHPDLQYAIVRTAWVYGTHGTGNFVKTMLRLGAEREELRVVYDQVGTPTWAAEIAKAIATLSTRFLQGSADLTGTYHFTNSGITSWYDFAIAIFEEAKALDIPLKTRRVIPITTPEYPTPAKRPAYSVLGCQKMISLLDAPPPQWRQSLRQMLTEFHSYSSFKKS